MAGPCRFRAFDGAAPCLNKAVAVLPEHGATYSPASKNAAMPLESRTFLGKEPAGNGKSRDRVCLY
jgi:hypothetical protein